MDDLTEDGFETPANLASLPPQVAERRTRQPATRALPRPVRKKRTFLALDSDSEDSADGKSPFKPPPSQFDDIKKRKQEKGISEPIVRTIERNMSSPLTNLPEHKLPRFRQSSYSNTPDSGFQSVAKDRTESKSFAISSTRPTPTDRDSMEGVTIDLPAQGSNVLNEGNKDPLPRASINSLDQWKQMHHEEQARYMQILKTNEDDTLIRAKNQKDIVDLIWAKIDGSTLSDPTKEPPAAVSKGAEPISAKEASEKFTESSRKPQQKQNTDNGRKGKRTDDQQHPAASHSENNSHDTPNDKPAKKSQAKAKVQDVTEDHAKTAFPASQPRAQLSASLRRKKDLEVDDILKETKTHSTFDERHYSTLHRHSRKVNTTNNTSKAPSLPKRTLEARLMMTSPEPKPILTRAQSPRPYSLGTPSGAIF